ncbi:MAG: hypothetical protein ACRD2N_00720 [Vicinamibacterales bacterium]
MPDTAVSDDPWLSALNSALDGSQPVDPFAIVKAQLEAQGDPRARLLLRILEQQRQFREAGALEWQQQQSALDDHHASTISPEMEGGEPAIDLQTDVRNVQQAVDALYEEMGVLRARTQALAAATGACAICFGEDPLCDECAGRGVPGSRRPEPRAFRKYVLPAYGRARAFDRARDRSQPVPRSYDHSTRTDTTTKTADER